MLRFSHNSPIRYIRFGNTCRTARYTTIGNRSEFLFYNSNPAAVRDAMPPFFRQSVPLRKRGTRRYASLLFNEVHIFHILMFTAAMRDATPPLFRQCVPTPERGTFRYVFVRRDKNGFFHNLSFSDAAALRDATPPQFSSSYTHLSDTSCCNAAGFSVGSFRVSSLPTRRTWPSGYPFFGGGGLGRPRLGADRLSAARPRLFLHFGFRSDIKRLWPEGAETGYFTSASHPAVRRIPEGAGFESMISAPLPFFCESTTFITSGFINFGEPVDGGCLIALFPIPAFRPGRIFRGRAAVNSDRGTSLCFVERRRSRFSFTPFRQ